MSENIQEKATTPGDIYQQVPAARPLSDFAVERVGDDLVILDGESMQYHTLNLAAAQIWQACDGVNSTNRIASELGLPIELVESTVSELGEAGLLQSPSNHWDSTLNRRRASKLIAAGLLGAVGLPVVKSITVPDAASAYTLNECMAIPGATGLCGSGLFADAVCTANCIEENDWRWFGSCISGGTGNRRCCVCSRWFFGLNSDQEELVITGSNMEESIDESDPYLATDEEGNVDLEAIDALEQEAAPETEAIEPIVEEVAPVEVVESQPAPVEVFESQPEPTEIVDTSSEGEQEVTEEQTS